MPDSIYYSSKLVPIPVKVLARHSLHAIVETVAGNRYKVLARRIIPIHPVSGRDLPR
jgi:hypothetical protein